MAILLQERKGKIFGWNSEIYIIILHYPTLHSWQSNFCPEEKNIYWNSYHTCATDFVFCDFSLSQN